MVIPFLAQLSKQLSSIRQAKEMPELLLYDYWRSSAAYRVRIALNLKNLDYCQQSVHLVRDGGEQKMPAYRAINPQGLVPTLQAGDKTLTQSLAIIEWLDEKYPGPALLPAAAVAKAQVRAMALMIACDIHPLNNLRVMSWLKQEAELTDETYMRWYHHWITEGFTAFEKKLELNQSNSRFCYGEQAGLADICLIPQVYNAERFNCDISNFPRIRKISAYCRKIPAFEKALPENQADAKV